MPLPGEHAARQLEPSACDRFRRENGKLGPGIDVIWCVRPGKAVEPQSIRFDAKKFTADEARAWLKKHGYSAANFEEAAGPAGASAAAAALCLESLPADLHCAAAGTLEIQALAGGVGGQPQVSGLAYTGVPMKLDGFAYPVVVDLESLKVPRQNLPILRNHDDDRIVGHSTAVEASPQRLKFKGVLSGLPAHADEVKQTAAGGFPWQVSIGAAMPRKPEFVPEGESATVNGRRWPGPLLVVRGASLRELSVLAMGADDNTQASVAAAAATLPVRGQVGGPDSVDGPGSASPFDVRVGDRVEWLSEDKGGLRAGLEDGVVEAIGASLTIPGTSLTLSGSDADPAVRVYDDDDEEPCWYLVRLSRLRKADDDDDEGGNGNDYTAAGPGR
jgi:hypothetical protein